MLLPMPSARAWRFAVEATALGEPVLPVELGAAAAAVLDDLGDAFGDPFPLPLAQTTAKKKRKAVNSMMNIRLKMSDQVFEIRENRR